jgi:hypothetical protein
MGRALPTLAALSLLACSEYALNKEAHGLAHYGDTGAPDPSTNDGDADPDWMRDRWDLADLGGADLLFFGDTSHSMTEELVTMGEKITTLLDALEKFTDDWQLLAVTGPSGCGIGGVLTPETPDYATAFATGITTPPGEDEVDEWGLFNASYAVDLTDPGECNEGFLRETARLHVIFISDEADHSPGWDSGDPSYWKTYLDNIVDRKSSLDLVRMSAIAGPVPDGCAGADPGYGYGDAALATGGVQLSICDGWYDQISSIVSTQVERDTFVLSAIPQPSTLEVNVNSVRISEGWAYDAASNSVLFSAEPPVTGDVVEIDYIPA